jgi:hypothetical protein
MAGMCTCKVLFLLMYKMSVTSDIVYY